MVFDIEWLESTSSTNRVLMEAAKQGAPSGRVLVADRQSAGCGRMGRSWVDTGQAEDALLCSVLWRFPQQPSATLSLVVGVALAQVLCSYGVPVGLKWPNDLYIAHAKLGGILIESSAGAAVIGFGLNLRAPQGVDQAVTGLWDHMLPVSRANLLQRILSALGPALLRYSEWGFAAWQQSWQDLCIHQQRWVSLYDPTTGALLAEGPSLGVHLHGALRVACAATSSVQSFIHGEVQLRYDATVS